MRLYVNGVLRDEATPVNPDTSNNGDNLKIGNAQSYFDGLIDEVQIYNRALSPSEIQALAER